jgi:crotonyl-CoA reductase
MTTEEAALREIYEAIVAGVSGEELARIPLPATYRAACLHSEESARFDGLEPSDRDPGLTLHLDEVNLPELVADEVLVAVMASSVNSNTVWSSIFYPVPTFALLRRLGQESPAGARHDLPYHVVGSDASGVILRVGPAVHRWRPGDRVVVHCNYVDQEDPWAHEDAMLARNQRIWGYETNFGGLGEATVVKASQLLPKAEHLTWEEAASTTLCASTAYRMLVSRNGAAMKQGDVVLIWGAAGGLGSFAVQFVLNGGATPVAVVGSPRKSALLQRLGCDAVIDRSMAGYRFWRDDMTQNEQEWRRFGRDIRGLVGDDPDIVFEHPGRETLGASVYVAKRGGTIVTCAATAGYRVEFDNRHLWMRLKTVKGSHFANYREAWDANRLIRKGRVHPTLSEVYPLAEIAAAVRALHRNEHHGKCAVLCLAPTGGLGVEDPAFRDRIGEEVLNRLRVEPNRPVLTAPAVAR